MQQQQQKQSKKNNEEKEEEKKGGGIQRVLFCVGGLGAKNAQRCKDVVRTVQQQYGNRTKTQQTLRQVCAHLIRRVLINANSMP